MTEEVDVLAIGAHPDDIEICCGGTVAQLVARGRRVGLVDLSLGELGTRGMVETRRREAQRAGEILGVCFRTNLGAAGWRDQAECREQESTDPPVPCLSARVDSKSLRGWTPGPLERNCPGERGRTPRRARETGAGVSSPSSRVVASWLQFDSRDMPDVVVNISETMDIKEEAILAHASQLHDPQSEEPDTILTAAGFLDRIPGPQSVHGKPGRLQVRGRIPALEGTPGTGS